MTVTHSFRMVVVAGVVLAGMSIPRPLSAVEPLSVAADFEGASVGGVQIDQASRTIEFTPGGDPVRGWPCWWYFRVDGLQPGDTLTLKLKGSTATVSRT